MMQITASTDGRFIGHVFDADEPIVLDGYVFVPDLIKPLAAQEFRYSNSNYVIDVKEI